MKAIFSGDRAYCADYAARHKSRIPKNRNFRTLSSLGIENIRSLLPHDAASRVRDTDYLCSHCYRYFASQLATLEEPAIAGPSSAPDEISDPPFVACDAHLIDDINETLLSANVDVTPLRDPTSLRTRQREPYAKRKFQEIQGRFSESIERKVSEAYGTQQLREGTDGCQFCPEWIARVRKALKASSSYQERCQIMTLVPPSMSKKDIIAAIPEATKHLIVKSRKLASQNGVWAAPDPYSGPRISPEDLQQAMRYYTDDNLGCTIQSPEKRDVVSARIDGVRKKVTKRYMTRSIREAYRIFKAAHPDTKIGLTKFYALRPSWVKYTTYRDECVCIYCANFTLCLTAIQNAAGERLSPGELKAPCTCNPASVKCLLHECKQCPGKEALTLQHLHLDDDDEEVYVATWDSGDLLQRCLDPLDFLEEVRKWTWLHIRHEFLRHNQGTAIYLEKVSVTSHRIVLHFDFAENWSVVLPSAVQGYHWRNREISIFTCVATTSKSTLSFAVISDDMRHDSAHAQLATRCIESWIEDNVQLFAQVTYVSDGAASHFKNRFQLYELGRSDYRRKWLFSATGHGKSACDGIGGVIKHLAALYNLRASPSTAVLSAEDLVHAVKVDKTEMIYLSSLDIARHREEKEHEWRSVGPHRGIQSSHLWCAEKDQDGTVKTIVHTLAPSV